MSNTTEVALHLKRGALAFTSLIVLAHIFYFTSVENDVRLPASTNSNGETNSLEQNTTIKKQILSGLEIITDNDSVGISLGMPLIGADSNLFCEQNEVIIATFLADGVSVSGEPVKMSVLWNCRPDHEQRNIQAFEIIPSMILNAKPANGEFTFTGENSCLVKFTNMADEWPTKWVLNSLLFQGNSKEVISITPNEINDFFKSPVAINLSISQ